MKIITNKIIAIIGEDELEIDDVGISFRIHVEKHLGDGYSEYLNNKKIQIHNNGKIEVLGYL